MDAITISQENWEKARKDIDRVFNEKKKVIVLGQDIEFNRLALENKKVSALILIHKGQKDRLKERASGLNQVLCKIAQETGKTILIDFKEILDSHGRERARILGRLIQNLMLLQKYHVQTNIINRQGRNDYDLFSFLLTLGSNTNFAKNSLRLFN